MNLAASRSVSWVESVRQDFSLSLCGLFVALIATACAPAISSGNAPDPRAVQPERPSVATHAGTVAPKYLEIETGIESDRNRDRTHNFQIPTVLKLGLAPVAQLSMFLPASQPAAVTLGIGDVGAGVKWRLVDGDGPLQRFAILPSITWPTGGSRGGHNTALDFLLIDSRTIGPVSLDLNVGVARHSGDISVTPRTTTLWTASSGIPVAGPVGWQLECFGYPGTHGPAGSAPTVAILTGPTLGAWRSLALDAGVILPVSGPQARSVYAGFVTNVGRVFP
jgi:hypothetical protein